MINLDQDLCTGCGMCVKVCHNCCLTLVDNLPRITQELCDSCTQCIAVCAQGALSWGGVPPVSHDPSRLPSADQLDELFRQRRSLRSFAQERIDRDLLREIVEYGIYAPTNNHDLRAVVVDDPEAIAQLEGITIDFNVRVYKLFFRPRLVYALVSRLSRAMTPQVRVKLEGRRYDAFRPAAMVFIVGDGRIAFSEASAQAYLDAITYTAQVRGIGSCLWGAGRTVLDRNREARALLGLGRQEHILGVLLLGYPAVRYANKVEGRALDITWVGG